MKEPSVRGVRIAIGVCVTMVQAVSDDPPLDRALETHRPHHGEDESERATGGEGAMRPQSMIADSYSQGGQLPIDVAEEI